MMQKVCVLTLLIVKYIHGFPSTRDVPLYKYDEERAMKFFDMAAAAYPDPTATGEPNRTQCLEQAFNISWSVNAVSKSCASGGTCQGFMAWSSDEQIDTPNGKKFPVVLSFRGTEGLTQFEKEIEAGMCDAREFNKTDESGNSVRVGGVNKYFMDAGDEFWNQFYGKIKELSTAKTYHFMCTGHSLGGALASYMAFRLSYSGLVSQTDIEVISFGEPRLGDKEFAMSYPKYVPNAFRVVHYRDPIPHMPPLEFISDMKPYHQIQEIWYDSGNTDMVRSQGYKTCSRIDGEDDNCSNKEFNNVISNIWNFFKNGGSMHVHYFSHTIPTYGLNGCVDAATSYPTLVVFVLSFLALFRVL